MKNYLLLLALAASFSISSCSKDDDDDDQPAPVDTNPPTVTIQNPLTGLTQGSTDPAVVQFTKDMLANTDWKLIALVKGVDNTLNFKDLYKDLQACQRDDSYSFNANGTLAIADNLNWCGANSQDKTGTWSMANSATVTITATGLIEGVAGQSTIMQISENSLVLQQKANGFTYVSTYEKNVPPPSELMMLINKDWKLVSDKTYYPSFTQDNYANAQNCEKDNFWRFSADGALTINEGATKCNSFDPQTFTTGFNIYGSELWIMGERYIVIKNTATELELNYSYYSQGFNVVNQTKFVKQ